MSINCEEDKYEITIMGSIFDNYGSIDNFQEIFSNINERFEEKMMMMLNIIDEAIYDILIIEGEDYLEYKEK